MDKEFAKNTTKLIKLIVKMIMCSSTKCEKEISKADKNKEIMEKYKQIELETNSFTKLKLFAELNNYNEMYEVNICIFKHCKKILKNIIKIYKSYASIVPKSNPKYDNIHNLINQLELLINTKNLSEKDYKIYLKNINELL
jgi:hypothetical protein